MKGMSGHQSARSGSDVWLTPRRIIDALGGWQSFDLDPAAAVNQPWPTARRHFTEQDNGLLHAWSGRIWLNPPYSRALIGRFMARMANHAHGTALIFARTETVFFHRYVWESADALLFCAGRLEFHRPDGSLPKWDGGAPSVLCAYGHDDADALAGSGIDGAFVPLRWRALWAGFDAIGTWAQEVEKVMARIGAAASLSEIYRHMASHPKAKRNPNWQAKIRQVLQSGPFESVERGIWRLEI